MIIPALLLGSPVASAEPFTVTPEMQKMKECLIASVAKHPVRRETHVVEFVHLDADWSSNEKLDAWPSETRSEVARSCASMGWHPGTDFTLVCKCAQPRHPPETLRFQSWQVKCVPLPEPGKAATTEPGWTPFAATSTCLLVRKVAPD